MNIIIIPAVTDSHTRYQNPNPEFDELAFLTRIADGIHARLTQSAKHTPFITIRKLTGTMDQIIAQLKQLTQTSRPSSNRIIAIGLNSTRLDGRNHTATGWSIIKSSQSKEISRLATSLTTEAMQSLGSRAASAAPNPYSLTFLNQTRIITATTIPAVLTLNLYQDNRQDTAYLLSSAGHQAIIDLHVKGISAYLSTLNPGNTPAIRQATALRSQRHRKSGSAESQSRIPTSHQTHAQNPPA